MEKTYVINIGRQLGSGGHLIGKKIAEDFGIKFYDKELLYLAARESGFNPELFEQSDEHKGKFRSFFTNFIPFVGSGDIYDNSVSEESLFSLLSDTIQKVAEEESCVIIGRCSEYILREKRRCANIFIHADQPDRVTRIADLKKITFHEAQKIIETCDEHRAAFHDFYSTAPWGVASTYHMSINSSILGIDGTTEYVEEFIRRKLSL